MKVKRLVLKHSYAISFHKTKERRQERKAITTQTADNCWMYSCFNNLWLNLGYAVSESDIQAIKSRLEAVGVATTTSNNEKLAMAVICERWNERNKDKIGFFELNFFDAPKKLGTLLKNGLALVYTRSIREEIQNDIKDNDVLDDIHKLKGERHASNVCLAEKGGETIMEIGQRGDGHYANVFSYKNVLLFGNNIKAGMIAPNFTFIDYL